MKRCNSEKKFRFVDPEFLANESAHDTEEKAKNLGAIMESIQPKELIIFPHNESSLRMVSVAHGRTTWKNYMWKAIKFVKIQSYTQGEIDEVKCKWARYTWQLAATYRN